MTASFCKLCLWGYEADSKHVPTHLMLFLTYVVHVVSYIAEYAGSDLAEGPA